VTIYLDVIWFLNFCIDALLLMLTAIILKRKWITWRIICSSLLGSSYVLLLFINTDYNVYHPLVKFLLSILIIWICFGYKRFSYFVQGLCMFYFVTFITGGGIVGLHYFLQSDVEVMGGMIKTRSSGMGDPVSWLFVFIAFPLLWLFTKRRIDHIEVKKVRYDQIVSVEIMIDSTVFKAKGLIDSGNQLHDPISKVPVMILDMTQFQQQFPNEIIERSKDILSLGEESAESHPWENRLRLIPYRSVGQSSQFLMALKPDKVKIHNDNEEYVTSKTLVGLSYTNLSSEGEYNAIIHPKMLLGKNVSTNVS
jgi:stage II sporulation protein GA (sporulation sigma-E factor processing peptidase)